MQIVVGHAASTLLCTMRTEYITVCTQAARAHLARCQFGAKHTLVLAEPDVNQEASFEPAAETYCHAPEVFTRDFAAQIPHGGIARAARNV